MSRTLVVKKFGGTSVGSVKRIQSVADRILEDYNRGQLPVVVASAMSGQTDHLIQLAEQVFPHFRGPAYDMLLSSGEQISIALLSLALEKRGLKTTPLLGHQAGIQTNPLFSKARIQTIDTTRLRNVIKEGRIPLVAGFQGVTTENRITTLGRGGSDLTAVALSVGLKQDMCEIYTDVDGVLTGDPRLIPSAGKISQLEFSEMMEMAALGSQVLQPRSVELGAKHQIKIHVRHALKKGEGTWIMNLEDKMEKSVVSAIAHDPNTAVIRISNIPEEEGFLAHLFNELGEESISVDIISKTETVQGPSLAFSINHEDVQSALKTLKKFVKEKQVLVVRNVAKISIIGVGMAHHSGVAGRFFSVFHKSGVPLHLITTSEIKISAIIDKKHLKKTANQLHKEFELAQNKPLKE